MDTRLRRYLVIALGWALILLGVIGLFLPILQGILFILMGLYVLSRESRWARLCLDRLRSVFPKTDAKFQQWKERAKARRRRAAAGEEKANPAP